MQVTRVLSIADGYLPLRPLNGGWQATMDKLHGWPDEAGRGRDPGSLGHVDASGTFSALV